MKFRNRARIITGFNGILVFSDEAYLVAVHPQVFTTE